MNKQKTINQLTVWILVSAGIIITALTRLVPHPANFTPVFAVALFSGACIQRKSLAFIIPMAAILLSDVIFQLIHVYGNSPITGFYPGFLINYACILLTIFFGTRMGTNKNIGKVLGYSIGTSLIFFVLSNFGTWLTAHLYTFDLRGLVQCFVAAIAFYNPSSTESTFFLDTNNFLGNLVLSGVLFSVAFFGIVSLAERFYKPAKA